MIVCNVYIGPHPTPPPDPKPERISGFVKYFEYTTSVRVKLFQLTFKKKCLNPKNSCTLYKPLGKRRTMSQPPPPPPPPPSYNKILSANLITLKYIPYIYNRLKQVTIMQCIYIPHIPPHPRIPKPERIPGFVTYFTYTTSV